MTHDTDPRPRYAAAIGWVHDLVGAVPADRLSDPTPCAEYDVRALLGHLVATLHRARAIAEGGDPTAEPTVVTGVADDGWNAAFDTAADKALAAWADDDLLDREVPVPWGRVPGRIALWGYLNEALVHGWDLAVATDQDAEADPALAEEALTVMRQALPAEQRGGPVPFTPVVVPAPDAGATEQLANWCGHARG